MSGNAPPPEVVAHRNGRFHRSDIPPRHGRRVPARAHKILSAYGGLVLLKACLNGPRSRREHPAIPVTPEEIAAATRGVVAAAGVDAVHLHVKDDEGADTFAASLSDATIRAVRQAAPGLPVGVTTGAWVEPDPVRRVEAIRAWQELPDFASVNWHEEGADLVAEALLERGIAVEAGLWHEAAVSAWLESAARGRCLRVLIELPDGLDAARTVREAEKLVGMVGDVGIVLHGEGTSCWPALKEAGRRGLATRIGLEDTLAMPDGKSAADNVALVIAALELLSNP